ncbi:MAG: sugar phosphate isomerase/epimerase [Armatimonadetes bacterium]|nr:sugar phosphate isomerase/epimerase [Armatimonadota bacterium]
MFRNLSPGAIGVNPADIDVFQAASSAGFEGLDPDFAPLLAGGSAAEFKARFEEHGLKIGGWGLPVAVYGSDEEYDAALSRLSAVAEAAASVGAVRSATWILPCSDTLPYEENFDFHVRRLKPCADVLDRFGCRLGLEFIGPRTFRETKPHAFIHTQDEMLALARAVGPNVGLLFDSWHWYTSHGTLEDIEGLTDDDIVQVHINDAPAGVDVDEQIDNVRALPGETGVIDLTGFLRTLNKIGYSGPVTPEPFSARLKEMSAERALKAAGEALELTWVKALGVR